MLSDEEKEAIEYWQYIRDTQIYDGYKGQVYAVTLLNLTEKQSKKIVKLKENKEEYIKKLEARKYMFNAETGEVTAIPIDNNYINKDKIKAKIEEVELNYFKANYTINELIEILQSLLDKE